MAEEQGHQSQKLTNNPLLRDLIALHEELRAAIDERWKRSLPFADGILDRWERARRLGFGDGTSVYDSCLILGDVKVGQNTWIGPQTVLDGSGGELSIGDYCSISAGVHIYTHNTVAWSLSGGLAATPKEPVTVGDRTYIGPQAVISQGVTVGSQVVIGAAALVNRDLPDNAIAFGAPARIVGHTVVDGDAVELVYDGERPG